MLMKKLTKDELPDLYSKGKKKSSRPKNNTSKKPQHQDEQLVSNNSTSSSPKTKTDKEKLIMKIQKNYNI